MPLSDEQQTELLEKVREIHAAIEAGLVVVLAPEAQAAIVDGVEQRVVSKIQPGVRNAMFTLQMNVPVPAGVATFSPRQRDGST